MYQSTWVHVLSTCFSNPYKKYKKYGNENKFVLYVFLCQTGSISLLLTDIKDGSPGKHIDQNHRGEKMERFSEDIEMWLLRQTKLSHKMNSYKQTDGIYLPGSEK